ncbi:2-dehydro-3-deoxygalactonokinase [Marinomonas sp. 15G1-11]|uniref:2-dehydro-3-deoxygalactonokinase n=1 Tax=Marinomonas phaeophyticola TaxID=3004091 RepID=A0ABT4JQ22_9GAMM|nr:2-dehydro-3-deoxygalactonokinase [Marinomonas sp. 15G1-11]MCZ2720391.1 2-dehydro-3-deoxygalactonokinase [Marinomonas sp. 15G1-11]
MKSVDWLIIDWGTTNFRAFAMNKEGVLVSKTERPLGLLQVKNNQFSSSLKVVLEGWLGEYQHLPILMAGMVGSAQGWIDTCYVETPTSINKLARKSHSFKLPWGAQATIIPGVRYRSPLGNFDVMRGEEVQLFGLQTLESKANFVALFPGTHCKHMQINANKLSSFTTFMTGELFSILLNHSILGAGLPKQQDSLNAFKKGISESNKKPLTNQLFYTRTHRLFADIDETEVSEYLSGLLIGEELKTLTTKNIYLVGDNKLCSRYQKACQILEIQVSVIDGDDVFLNGMLQIKKALNDEK